MWNVGILWMFLLTDSEPERNISLANTKPPLELLFRVLNRLGVNV